MACRHPPTGARRGPRHSLTEFQAPTGPGPDQRHTPIFVVLRGTSSVGYRLGTRPCSLTGLTPSQENTDVQVQVRGGFFRHLDRRRRRQLHRRRRAELANGVFYI
ncbi:MAG: hypothetical protein R2710_08455 [Acidimicrobiales bacterium]